MTLDKKWVKFDARLLLVGLGSVGRGVLPLILRHIDMPRENITIVTGDEGGAEVAAHYGLRRSVEPLTRENYLRILNENLRPGDFLLNLSVDVSSVALIEYCQQHNVKYIDTCIEPWAGGYTDTALTPSQRSNYALREAALGLRKKYGNGATAVLTHGANPGLVSHFVKQALLNIAQDTGVAVDTPNDKAGWAALGQQLGVKVIHIAERDTQVSKRPKQRNEFVNTWSVEGFVGEGCQPAELGWGSHEKHFPHDGKRHDFGSGAAIYLQRPGASTRVRTWTPREGPFHGFLITHSEAISIADYFTLRSGADLVYRPTVHYAYHPCDAAVMSIHELAGKNWQLQDQHRIMVDEVEPGGIDELGVLLAGHKKGAYWYGSVLSVDEARQLAPHTNATGLQVTSSVLAALVWAIENPNRGVIDPDEVPFQRIMEITRPYLGKLVGAYTDWTPLYDRGRLFAEDVDAGDPWQFKNIRVV